MREFFRGWKRRVGAVTLLMACVFAMIWVISLYRQDVLRLSPSKSSLEYFQSCNGAFTWMRYIDAHPMFVKRQPLAWGAAAVTFSNEDICHCHLINKVKWRLSLLGAVAGEELTNVNFPEYNGPATRVIAVKIPYWFIILPMTLLSAWLLLRGPRIANPQQSTEPAPVHGE
jgi:hypothetical protein